MTKSSRSNFQLVATARYDNHNLSMKEYVKQNASHTLYYVIEIRGSKYNFDYVIPVRSFSGDFSSFVQKTFDKVKIVLDNTILEGDVL